MTCKMCRERGQTWSGSPPNCYFDEPLYENWNCATVNAIMDICGGYPDEARKGVVKLHIEDVTLCLIDITERELEYNEDSFIPCLYVQWYKRRGATERLLLLGEETNREPTEKELLSIINYYNTQSY